MWTCLKRLARPRAAIVLFGSEPFSSALRVSNLEWFKYDWIWEKSEGTGHLSAAARPLKYHEIISVFGQGEPYYSPQKWQGTPNHSRTNSVGKLAVSNIHNRSYVTPVQDDSGMKCPRSVIHFDIIKPTIKRHESEKPLALMEYLVKTYTNPGDRVLDFTSGSGTTLRACKNLGRACVGIEQDAGYCAATVKRLAPAFEEALVDDGATLEDLPMFAQNLA